MTTPAHKTEGVNRTKAMRFLTSSFTGKERDEETGYGYFGARYMDYELTTMWLSVDPMSDKYPSISPYAYCAWNPVKLVDPEGNEPVKPLIKYYGKGTFMVNTDNLRSITRNQIAIANYDNRNWGENSIGVNLTVGHYHSPRVAPVFQIPQDFAGVDSKDMISQTPPVGNIKKDGTPYYNRYSWNSCVKGPKVGRSAGLVIFGLDLLIYGAGMYQLSAILNDNNELQRQTRLLDRAAGMVTAAVKRGIFNESQSTDNDFLGDVINYIYQGEWVNHGGMASGREISPEAISKAKEIMRQNSIKTPLLLSE